MHVLSDIDSQKHRVKDEGAAAFAPVGSSSLDSLVCSRC